MRNKIVKVLSAIGTAIGAVFAILFILQCFGLLGLNQETVGASIFGYLFIAMAIFLIIDTVLIVTNKREQLPPDASESTTAQYENSELEKYSEVQSDGDIQNMPQNMPAEEFFDNAERDANDLPISTNNESNFSDSVHYEDDVLSPPEMRSGGDVQRPLNQSYAAPRVTEYVSMPAERSVEYVPINDASASKQTSSGVMNGAKRSVSTSQVSERAPQAVENFSAPISLRADHVTVMTSQTTERLPATPSSVAAFVGSSDQISGVQTQSVVRDTPRDAYSDDPLFKNVTHVSAPLQPKVPQAYVSPADSDADDRILFTGAKINDEVDLDTEFISRPANSVSKGPTAENNAVAKNTSGANAPDEQQRILDKIASLLSVINKDKGNKK